MSLVDLELKISQFLRRGVLLAGLLMLVGWVKMLLKHSTPLTAFSTYHTQTLWESLQWAFIMDDSAVILVYSGLFILVTLPIFRVLMAGVLFAKRKERILSAMAFLVLSALIASFFLGVDL